jgi:uncharacterized protein YecE (DUF72 family)
VSCEIRIGASGWHYKHWRGPFYDAKLPASRMLAVYLEHFDTVEINNSFYRLPSEETFANWRAATPADIRFAVKASRFITHNKKLGDPESALDKFFPRVEKLKEKLGPILFQLPPQWRANAERLEGFLRLLPAGLRYAFEMRNETWHNNAIFRILSAYNAAFCVYHLAGFEAPVTLTADFTYLRLHGPGGKYQGSYSREALRRWAQKIEEWRGKLKAIYVYFDNDQEAFAVRNALEFKRMVSGD